MRYTSCIRRTDTAATTTEYRVAEKRRFELTSGDQLKSRSLNFFEKGIFIMKVEFLVGVKEKSKIARLEAVKGSDLAENRKSGVGLTNSDIFGPNFEVVFQADNKEDCLKYIKTTLDGRWRVYDHTAKPKKLGPGEKMYAVMGNVAAAEIWITQYHTGEPNLSLGCGHDRVIYQSTRRADCERFVKNFYERMEEIYND